MRPKITIKEAALKRRSSDCDNYATSRIFVQRGAALNLSNKNKNFQKKIDSKLIILSLGGSIIFPEEIDVVFLKQFKALILKLLKQGYEFIIICGGGKICRKYQAASKELNQHLASFDLDWMGIEVTKMNAYFMRTVFKEHAHPKILVDPTKRLDSSLNIKNAIIFGAGWKPGCSTDMAAVLAAKTYGAKTILNMSNIEYIYNKDPNKFSDAKKIEKMTWPEFKKMFGETFEPGGNYPFDPVAGKNAATAGQRVIILDGRDISNLKDCIEGRKFNGSVIG